MHSDMNKIPIFCKIQIGHAEQFTITQITSSAQERTITGGCELLSLEMIQKRQKPGAGRLVEKGGEAPACLLAGVDLQVPSVGLFAGIYGLL